MASRKAQFAILCILAVVITCLAADRNHQRNHNRNTAKHGKKKYQADAPLPSRAKRTLNVSIRSITISHSTALIRHAALTIKQYMDMSTNSTTPTEIR